MLISKEELERRAAELRARLSEWELGYLIGLVEGEASFDVDFNKRIGRGYPRIQVYNNDSNILNYFRNKLNIGHVYIYQQEGGNHKTAYGWRIWGREALILLKAIFNYLFSCKKNKAALLLSLNKKNEGRYAELIYKQVKKLNSYEEDLNLQPKRIGDFSFEGLTQFQLGLIAGLTDSEGTIHIEKRGYPHLKINNTCPRLILRILKMLRGCGLGVYHPQRGRKYYVVRAANRKVGPFLEKIKDFLLIKQKQAGLAIEAARMISRRERHVLPAVRKRREEIYWSIRALNARGRSYSGGPTALAPPHPRLGIDWSLPHSLVLINV